MCVQTEHVEDAARPGASSCDARFVIHRLADQRQRLVRSSDSRHILKKNRIPALNSIGHQLVALAFARRSANAFSASSSSLCSLSLQYQCFLRHTEAPASRPRTGFAPPRSGIIDLGARVRLKWLYSSPLVCTKWRE
jgi:hypothetical protein